MIGQADQGDGVRGGSGGRREGQVGQVGRRPGQIEGGVDQENIAKDPDTFDVSPPAEEGDHLLQEDSVKKNAGSIFGNELLAIFPESGEDVFRQLSQLFLIGQTGKPCCSHKYIRVITINKIFQTECGFDA